MAAQPVPAVADILASRVRLACERAGPFPSGAHWPPRDSKKLEISHNFDTQMEAVTLDRPSGAASPSQSEKERPISIEHLRVVYPAADRRSAPKVAVNDLSLEVREGEVFGFLGPNGAGKTTTMNVLLGFVQPTSGKAEIYGRSVTDEAARYKLGYLPELTYYYKFLTGREHAHCPSAEACRNGAGRGQTDSFLFQGNAATDWSRAGADQRSEIADPR
jgi:ABC-type multidrug transport system fused ATPase/permease subunit